MLFGVMFFEGEGYISLFYVNYVNIFVFEIKIFMIIFFVCYEDVLFFCIVSDMFLGWI